MTTGVGRRVADRLIGPVFVAGLCLAPAAAALDYDESISGDIVSNDEWSPTWIGSLDPGLNVISGTASAFAQGGGDGDVFSVTLLPGTSIDSIQVSLDAFSGGTTAKVKVFETPYQSIHSFQATAPVTYPIPGTPLAPGGYGFTSTTPNSTLPGSYEWTWFVTVPEPARGAQAAAAATLLGIARAAGATRRRRRARRARGGDPVLCRGEPAPRCRAPLG